MNVTNNLKLPQYTEDDIFNLQDINKAYSNIDNAYKEVIDFKNEIPKTNATAEVIDARGGKETLGKRLDEFGSQLDTMVYCLRGKKETEIDDTTRIQEAINELKNVGGNIYLTEKEYVVSNTLVIDFIANGNKKLNIIGKNGCNVTFLTKCEGKNTLLIKNANDGNYDDGVSISNIQIKPYDNTYNYKCNGIMLQNAIGCKLSNIHVYNMEYGIIFENDLGYTEQNVITNCLFSNCNRGVTFRVSARNEKWNGSFHGNIFKNTCISVIRNNAKALNIEGGQLYNCRFDLKIMSAGTSPYLIYFNGDSEGNTGDISYEMFDSNRPKIACGDNARAKFFLSGNIFGKGGDIDWSEYKPISVGDLDYNNNRTPLESGDVHLGREKFYCYNIAPSNEIINNNKTIRYKPILSNIYDLWSGITNLFARYQNLDGKMENGYVMACKQEEGANSRLILGTIDHPKNNIKDMVIGMELSSDGSKIKSKQGSQLEFNNGYLSRNGKKIVDTGNLRFGKAIYKGFMYYPEGLKDIWGNIPITAGTSSTTVTLSEFELESIYNVQVTFLGANTGSNQVQVINATKSAITIGWNCSNNGTCYFRLLGYTPT